MWGYVKTEECKKFHLLKVLGRNEDFWIEFEDGVVEMNGNNKPNLPIKRAKSDHGKNFNSTIGMDSKWKPYREYSSRVFLGKFQTPNYETSQGL